MRDTGLFVALAAASSTASTVIMFRRHYGERTWPATWKMAAAGALYLPLILAAAIAIGMKLFGFTIGFGVEQGELGD